MVSPTKVLAPMTYLCMAYGWQRQMKAIWFQYSRIYRWIFAANFLAKRFQSKNNARNLSKILSAKQYGMSVNVKANHEKEHSLVLPIQLLFKSSDGDDPDIDSFIIVTSP